MGLTPDERRDRRRRLLIDAGFDLLGSEGASATTVRAVCQQAELNPRYFYESFEDIDALLIAVYDDVGLGLAEAMSAVEIPEGADPVKAARIGMDALVRFIDEDRRRARVIYIEALANVALAAHRVRLDQEVVLSLEARAIEAAGSWPQGERVGRVGAAMLVGGLGEVLRDWVEGRIDVSREQLVDDLAVLTVALGAATEQIARRRAAKRR